MLTPPRRRWHKVASLDDHGPIPLTKEAHARMKARLARIKARLPALAAEAGETAALGDRSDNAAYKEAKSLLRRAQRQVFTLEDQLTRVVEISPGTDERGAVRLGSTVVVASSPAGAGPATEQRSTYVIVGPFETDPASGRISHKSPLGSALIGKTTGDAVTVSTARGPRHYRIIEVR